MAAIASRRLIVLSLTFAGRIAGSIALAEHLYFVYRQTMAVTLQNDEALARVAAAIGDASRARILCSLLDGHARTSTELAMVANVTPSTASVHLSRLKSERLVKLLVQGKHRYYSLEGTHVAKALEALMVVAGSTSSQFTPSTPVPLRSARTCYDHMAGAVAVSLHDRFIASRWILPSQTCQDAYELTPAGTKVLDLAGMDVAALRNQRRRFAYACLDWSERSPHIAGALGAALLQLALKRKWMLCDLDSRALTVTRTGQREFSTRFGMPIEAQSGGTARR